LLVVPLAPGDVALLSLGEWDALLRSERVIFERPDHPLLERLLYAGVDAGPLDDEPRASAGGWALVADPDSQRVLELARDGAEVSAGTARPPDAVTAAHAAPTVRRAAASLAGLTAIMARLRSDDGCPWDREQTHRSLLVHLLEEAHEVIDAIEGSDPEADLREELGDLLLQVAFHARLAEQEGGFDLADVADGIVAKLVYRHPHVFGDVRVSGAGEVLRNWDTIKRTEKRRASPFDGIPASLPALLAAAMVQKRALGTGFESDETTTRRRVDEALDRRDVGEALFWLVALARAGRVDPESALREATRAFRRSVTG
jgi:XTP/dITP diphosphohydrolase